jgi:hypothetical protein
VSRLKFGPSLVVCVCLSVSATAHASGTGHASGSVAKSPSPTRASTPPSSSQHQVTPAKPHNSPPAGVRPHTDLAAATKLISLSSANLTKRSQLFPKMPLPPGSPELSGPVLNKIGATQGGSASFKAVAGIPAALSSGSIYPTNGGGAGGGKSAASLSGSAAASVFSASATDGDGKSSGGGWLLTWLMNLGCVVGMGGLAWWMWQQAPKGARIGLPATIPA